MIYNGGHHFCGKNMLTLLILRAGAAKALNGEGRCLIGDAGGILAVRGV
jgi:hypothetical protein